MKILVTGAAGFEDRSEARTAKPAKGGICVF